MTDNSIYISNQFVRYIEAIWGGTMFDKFGGGGTTYMTLQEGLTLFISPSQMDVCLRTETLQVHSASVSGHFRILVIPGPQIEVDKEFHTVWVPIFRRNFWVLGFPMEHSMHEEMEWSLWYRDNVNVDGSLPPFRFGQ